MNELENQIKETKKIFSEIDEVSRNIFNADVAQFMDLYQWKIDLAYKHALLWDMLTVYVAAWDEMVANYTEQGDSNALAEKKANITEVGKIMKAVKNKLKGSERLLTHTRDRLRGLEEEKFNQF